DGHRPEYAELHCKRLLERRAALRLRHVMGEWRPGQRHAGALGLGRGRLRFGAADGGNAAFAARNALRRLVDVTDRALAADRAVIAMRRRNAEPIGQQLLRIAIAPAQEVDDGERAELVQQFRTGVLLGALHGVFEQRERLEAVRNFLRAVDDLADADNDGNAVWGGEIVGHLAPNKAALVVDDAPATTVIASEAKQSRATPATLDCRVASLLAMTVDRRSFRDQCIHMLDGVQKILLEFLHHGAGRFHAVDQADALADEVAHEVARLGVAAGSCAVDGMEGVTADDALQRHRQRARAVLAAVPGIGPHRAQLARRLAGASPGTHRVARGGRDHLLAEDLSG